MNLDLLFNTYKEMNLDKGKHLLAFSAGSDSVFLLVTLGLFLKDKLNVPAGGYEILVSKDETMSFELSKGLTKQGYGRTFNEFNSPFTINYCITYSTEADFSKFSTANFGIFVREIIGCSLYRKNNLFITTSKIHSDDYILNNGDYIIEGFCKTFK